MVQRLTGVFTILAAFACTPAATVPQSKTAAPKSKPVQAQVASEPDIPDEHSFNQRSGEARRVQLPNAVATVVGRLTTPQATYLRLRATPGIALKEAIIQSVTDGAGRPLAAVASTLPGGSAVLDSASDYELLIRLGNAQPKETLTVVRWTARRLPSSNSLAGGYEQTLTIPAFDKAPVQQDLERHFGEAMSAWFHFRNEGSPFMAFAEARVLGRLVNPRSKKESARSRERR